MRRGAESDDEELGELVDTTAALTLHSKRTERARKKQSKRANKPRRAAPSLLNLPFELLFEIMTMLRPSDIFRLSRACRSLHSFVGAESANIAAAVTQLRYPSLAKCFRLPVLVEAIDAETRGRIQRLEGRPQVVSVHKTPFQHIAGPDPALVCTCLTCRLRWSALCVSVDFAHWTPNLDQGEPIPVIARGAQPEWNRALVAAHAAVVRRALRSPLWHAAVLEAHLASTVRAVRRHAANKGNRRRRFRMTEADARAGTDAFLARSGPPNLDLPFQRDNYYMLEAYLPNRSWLKDEDRWVYLQETHDRDLGAFIRWAEAQAGVPGGGGGSDVKPG